MLTSEDDADLADRELARFDLVDHARLRQHGQDPPQRREVHAQPLGQLGGGHGPVAHRVDQPQRRREPDDHRCHQVAEPHELAHLHRGRGSGHERPYVTSRSKAAGSGPAR